MHTCVRLALKSVTCPGPLCDCVRWRRKLSPSRRVRNHDPLPQRDRRQRRRRHPGGRQPRQSISYCRLLQGGKTYWSVHLSHDQGESLRFKCCREDDAIAARHFMLALFSFQVSRCCGLKITSSGFVVTLAKNNHHVLVLDTLYVC